MLEDTPIHSKRKPKEYTIRIYLEGSISVANEGEELIVPT
jgi:hypothetical protein